MSVSDNSSGRGSIAGSPAPGTDNESIPGSGESLYESELSLNGSPTNSVSEPVNPLETELQLQDLPVLMTTETLNQLPGPTLNFPSNYLEHSEAIGHPISESNESIRSMVSNLRSFLQRNSNLGSSDSTFCRRELTHCLRLVSTPNDPSPPLARPTTSISTRYASPLAYQKIPDVCEIDDDVFKTDNSIAFRTLQDPLRTIIHNEVKIEALKARQDRLSRIRHRSN